MDRAASHLSRRQFVVSTSAAAGALLAGCGPLPFQRPSPTAARVHHLGWLSGDNPDGSARVLDIFRTTLGELGYLEGQNLAIEYRWGDGNEGRLAAPAAELVRLPVDVIVVPSVGVARIARDSTTTVPIVLAGTGDLVAVGLAASYAHPGGNVTGVTNLATKLNSKRLQLLKEAVPSISRVAVLLNSESPIPLVLGALDRDAQAVGVQLHPMEPRGPEEFETAFDNAAREGAEALLVTPSPLGAAHRTRIVELAARLYWPVMYYRRQFVEVGGLMAYDASLTDLWRRAAVYVDKILKGANPADLPIEQPMTFDFVVNLKTAQVLGITFPNEIMLQVTEVLQ